MFKRNVQSLRDVLMATLRQNGLETPLLQRRLVDAWPRVAGEAIARYTTDAFISNQTLIVRLKSPALRADLSMRRTELVQRLNHEVGSTVIYDIKFC